MLELGGLFNLRVPWQVPHPMSKDGVRRGRWQREPCLWMSRGRPGHEVKSHTCHLPLSPGEVFFVTCPEQFTFQEALEFCDSHNAMLASTGQLYASWSRGLDTCYAGWLADGSLRYAIVTPGPACGGDNQA